MKSRLLQLAVILLSVLPLPLVAQTVLPGATVGIYYTSGTCTVPGEGETTTPPLDATVTGTLPPGLDVDRTTGYVKGTPTTAGTYTFTVSRRDSAIAYATCSDSYSLTVRDVTPQNQTATTATAFSGSACSIASHTGPAATLAFSTTATRGTTGGAAGHTASATMAVSTGACVAVTHTGPSATMAMSVVASRTSGLTLKLGVAHANLAFTGNACSVQQKTGPSATFAMSASASVTRSCATLPFQTEVMAFAATAGRAVKNGTQGQAVLGFSNTAAARVVIRKTALALMNYSARSSLSNVTVRTSANMALGAAASYSSSTASQYTISEFLKFSAVSSASVSIRRRLIMMIGAQ